MAPRSQKLLAAAAVVALGLVLAWPFRRTERPEAPAQVWHASPGHVVAMDKGGVSAPLSESFSESLYGAVALEEGLHGESVELRNREYAGLPYLAASATSVDADGVAESIASSEFAEEAPNVAMPERPRVDIGNAQGAPPPGRPLTALDPSELKGVIYSTAEAPTLPLPFVDEEPAEEYRRYVIHNGDTLDKLAARYLGDAGRALELFDLNREVLANPHVLPIGAEILIPRKAHLRRK